MQMNYSFLDTHTFATLVPPNLKLISASEIATFTDTSPFISLPSSLIKYKNPISIESSASGLTVFWSFKDRLNNTSLSYNKNSIAVISHSSTKLTSSILSISTLQNPSEKLILCETSSGYALFNMNLQLIQSQDLPLKAIHLNPYYPNQIAYLTDTHLCLLGKSNYFFPSSGFEGFEFSFSPFQMLLYSQNKIFTKDIRQEKDQEIATMDGIEQVLPIDCCYSVAVLRNEIEIYDFRYWKLQHSYKHTLPGHNWHLMTYPQRTSMYSDGMICEFHTSLYAKSSVIEEIPHKTFDSLQEMIYELTIKSERTGKLKNSIQFSPLNPLLAAYPVEISNEKLWIQSSHNGGLFIENKQNPANFGKTLLEAKLSHTRVMQTAKFYDRTDFLEDLFSEKLHIPESSRPSLLYSVEPEFEDFEDDG